MTVFTKRPGERSDSNLQLPVSRLLDSQEVATALKIHRKTLQRYVRARRITATSTGKNLKFRPADVHAFYNANFRLAGRPPRVLRTVRRRIPRAVEKSQVAHLAAIWPVTQQWAENRLQEAFAAAALNFLPAAVRARTDDFREDERHYAPPIK